MSTKRREALAVCGSDSSPPGTLEDMRRLVFHNLEATKQE